MGDEQSLRLRSGCQYFLLSQGNRCGCIFYAHVMWLMLNHTKLMITYQSENEPPMISGGYSDHDPHGGGGGYDDHHSGYGKEAPKADEGYGGGERGIGALQNL